MRSAPFKYISRRNSIGVTCLSSGTLYLSNSALATPGWSYMLMRMRLIFDSNSYEPRCTVIVSGRPSSVAFASAQLSHEGEYR